MRELIIICNDSFGASVRMIAEKMNEYNRLIHRSDWFMIKGYLCVDGYAPKQNENSLPVLGSPEEWIPHNNEVFAMGIVSPGIKKKYVELMKNKGARFCVLWAPWVLTPLSMKFGEGCIIAAHCIHEKAIIQPFVTLYKSMVDNTEIGSYSSVMGFSNITNAKIGEMVYVGNNAAIMMDLTVGDGAYVCDNSVVVKNVKPGTKVSGIPAKRIKNEMERSI
jgi:acetyltransferase-like isoleucine patch superfamily enzyme